MYRIVSAARARLLIEGAIRHAMTPNEVFPDGDHRVGFTVIVPAGLSDGRGILFVGALPPSTVDYVESVLDSSIGRVHVSDFHVGTPSGEPTPDVDVQDSIERILRSWVLPDALAGDLLHARNLALQAATKGHRWTGTEADLPPRCRAASPRNRRSEPETP